MNIEYIKGDLLLAPQKMLIHGCNDVGVMGSGVALQFRNKWPEVFTQYTKYCETNENIGGNVNFVQLNDGSKIIANAITQNFFGKDGKRYAKYDWIADCFHIINEYCSMIGIEEIAMPMIGAGYGGGSWNVIEQIIMVECIDVRPVVYTI